MRWTFGTLNATVDAEIRALSADMQARFLRYGDIIERAGFEGLPRELELARQRAKEIT